MYYLCIDYIDNMKEYSIQEQVVKAGQQLFQQYGLHKVTMEDVAKAVGKAKSSLYYYYKSKEEIFNAVMNAEIGEIIAELTTYINQESGVENKIRVFSKTKLHISKKRRALYNDIDMGIAIHSAGVS